MCECSDPGKNTSKKIDSFSHQDSSIVHRGHVLLYTSAVFSPTSFFSGRGTETGSQGSGLCRDRPSGTWVGVGWFADLSSARTPERLRLRLSWRIQGPGSVTQHSRILCTRRNTGTPPTFSRTGTEGEGEGGRTSSFW